MRVCVRACAVEIKLGVLRTLLIYAFGRAYGLPYKMATFISKKGLFNTVYCVDGSLANTASQKYISLHIQRNYTKLIFW